MKTFKEFILEARRMRVLRTAHYTTPENKEKILQTGFKPGRTGAYHPREDDYYHKTVYTTPSSRIGREYGKSRVNLSLVNPKVKTTTSKIKYKEKVKELSNKHSGEELVQKAKSLSPYYQSSEAIKKGEKIVKVPDAHHDMSGHHKGSYIMVDKDVANKSISKNPPPTIRAKGKPQRTKTQPKKK